MLRASLGGILVCAFAVDDIVRASNNPCVQFRQVVLKLVSCFKVTCLFLWCSVQIVG